MKLIIAIIKPFKLDEVREALTRVGVQGLTVSEVKGYGRQKGSDRNLPRRRIHGEPFCPRSRSRSPWPSAQVDKAVEAINGAAKTGQIGDGKIFVLELDDAVRIRTGETGAAAL